MWCELLILQRNLQKSPIKNLTKILLKLYENIYKLGDSRSGRNNFCLFTNYIIYMNDTYWEHEQHKDYWDKDCSTCYSERKKVLNKPCGVSEDSSPRKQDWELADERSEHSNNNYW